MKPSWTRTTGAAEQRRASPSGWRAALRPASAVLVVIAGLGGLGARAQAQDPARLSAAVPAAWAAALPPLPAPGGPRPERADGWQLPNPYRGLPAEALLRVREAGAAAYGRHCAVCHGAAEAATPSPEGPDLRRLDSACRRLADRSQVPRCQTDVDTYFLQSVLDGKLRAGQMHMPAWRGLISQEEIWAVRSYTEALAVPPPRRLADLPPVAP
ncbi:MAG: hypothetical protein RLY78_3408 [Pseudomonadota bacterium]